MGDLPASPAYLLKEAQAASTLSYVPHSKQSCGVALLTSCADKPSPSSASSPAPTACDPSGASALDSSFPLLPGLLVRHTEVFRGCSIDNASFSLSLCAAQVAIAGAVSAGVPPERYLALAVYTDLPRVEDGVSGSLPSAASRVHLSEAPPEGVATVFPACITRSMGSGDTNSSASKLSSLCGVCRCFIAETCPADLPIFLHQHGGGHPFQKTCIQELLPYHPAPPPNLSRPDSSSLDPGYELRDLEPASEIFPYKSSTGSGVIEAPTPAEILELCRLAVRVCGHAHIPYLQFPVGAALLTGDGEVFAGCNVMCGSFPCGVCAERSAIGRAVGAGKVVPAGAEKRRGGGGGTSRRIRAIAVVCLEGEGTFSRPCGSCRQFLVEFGNFYVICMKLQDKTSGKYSYQIVQTRDLLPECFVLD